MELSTEKVQETPEKRMRREREATINMGSKQDTLTRPRLRLRLPLRQSHGPGNDQTGGGQLFQILLPEQRSDPIALDPTWHNADLNDDTRFIFFPFAAPVAFFARSSAAILSFTMVAGGALAGWRCRGRKKMQWRSGERRRGLRAHSADASAPMPFKDPLPSG